MTKTTDQGATIVFRKGHEFRDGEGNLVGTMARDVRRYDGVSSRDVILPDGEHPVAGSVIPAAILVALRKAGYRG